MQEKGNKDKGSIKKMRLGSCGLRLYLHVDSFKCISNKMVKYEKDLNLEGEEGTCEGNNE